MQKLPKKYKWSQITIAPMAMAVGKHLRNIWVWKEDWARSRSGCFWVPSCICLSPPASKQRPRLHSFCTSLDCRFEHWQRAYLGKTSSRLPPCLWQNRWVPHRQELIEIHPPTPPHYRCSCTVAPLLGSWGLLQPSPSLLCAPLHPVGAWCFPWVLQCLPSPSLSGGRAFPADRTGGWWCLGWAGSSLDSTSSPQLLCRVLMFSWCTRKLWGICFLRWLPIISS